jgi:aminomethyltransferase
MNKQTPLHAEHLALNARIAPFGGWDMPIQYTGILAEHTHTRQHAAIFDISHMGELELSGPTAAADLEHLLTQNIATLRIGQCRYGYLLNETGGVLDDLTCYRLAETRFLLVVNAATCAADTAWIQAHLSPQTQLTDLSPAWAKIDIQGPTSRAAIEAVYNQPLPDLRYFHALETEWAGTPMLISRTGYTGEWGYEWYFPAQAAPTIWRTLLTAPNLQPAGLGARDTLRLEVGYPLYGHELTPHRTPVAAAGNLFIDTQKSFIGRDAVLRDLENGPAEQLVGLTLDGKRAAREGDTVWSENQQIGTITSGSYAPSLNHAIAFAYIRTTHNHPDTPLEIQSRNKTLPAKITTPPFYKKGTARTPN